MVQTISDNPLEIVIKTRNNAERNRLGKELHQLLRETPDYVDNAIVLNIDQDKRIKIWVFDESKTEMKVVPKKKGE